MITPDSPHFPEDPIPPEESGRQPEPDESSWRRVIAAAHLLRQFPDDPEIQRYSMAVSTFRITAEEFTHLAKLCRKAAARS